VAEAGERFAKVGSLLGFASDELECRVGQPKGQGRGLQPARLAADFFRHHVFGRTGQ